MALNRSQIASWLARTLEHVPDRHVTSLRSRYARSVESGPAPVRWVLSAVVGVARHRPLPAAEFSLVDYPDVKFMAADSRVERFVYWYGARGYEGAETEWWRRFCASSTHIVELGSNVGYYTVHGALANPSSRYIAVEPHPSSAATVRSNLALNNIDNVEVIEAAAVAPGGPDWVELSIPELDRYPTPEGAFLKLDGEGIDHIASTKSVRVATVDAAGLIEGADLIKLDIEGHEADVLEPSFKAIVAAKPTIFLEVRKASVPRLRRLILDLSEAGYVVFAIGESSLHLIPHDDLDPSKPLVRYGSRDLILVDSAAVIEM